MTIDRGSFTPPPSFNSRPSYPPKYCRSENRNNYSCASPSTFSGHFHVIHKVPSGDSPYVRAKRVQLIDKDPAGSISLFWRAINSGDRIDSALKDMAVAMKRLDRSDEAVEAIRSFRHLCSKGAQESLDNILIELFKHSGRLEGQVEILQEKLKRVEEEAGNDGMRKKIARSHGKKIHITMEQEYSRLLGNLGWVHLEQNNYKVAEEYYRKALSIELDKNKQCNLAVCLMYMNRITEAKLLLQSIKDSSTNQQIDESYAKSYERAHELLDQIELHGGLDSFMKAKENHSEEERDFDCQSQLDYIDSMCAIGDGEKSETAQRLFTQPINWSHRKVTQQPRRYVILGCGAIKELNGDNNTTSSPCNLQYIKEALLTDGAELAFQEPNEFKTCGAEKNWQHNLFLRDSNDKRVNKSPITVQQSKDLFLPSWSCKSGKRWDGMAGEDNKEEDSLDYIFPFNGEQQFFSGAQLFSKSSSVRRSLSFDHH